MRGKKLILFGTEITYSTLLIMCVMGFSYLSLWLNTVYSRYKNAEMYAVYKVTFDKVISSEPVILSQISMALCFLCIYLIFITNLKSVIKNKRVLIYSLTILCVPYLLLKSDEPLSYILSISNGSVQLGPWTLIGVLMFFIAYNPNHWQGLMGAFKFLTFLILISSLYGLVQYYNFYNSTGITNRVVALKWLWSSTICLQFILVYWLFRRREKKKRRVKYFVFFLIILQYSMALLTEMRLIILMTTFSIIVYLFKIGKIKKGSLVLLSFLSSGVFFTLYIMSSKGVYLPETNLFNSSVNSFLSRFTADTRSSDLIEFTSFITGDFLKFFPLGAGYSLVEDFKVDSGVLNTFFMTGPFMFFMAILLLVVPTLKLSSFKLEAEDAWVWAIAITWIIRFFSSSTMAFNTEFLIFILVAGRCAWILDGKLKTKKSLSAKINM